MKRLTVIAAIGLPVLLMVAVPVGFHYRTQHQLQEMTQELKAAVPKDFNDPESARLRNVRLISWDEAPLNKRVPELWEAFVRDSKKYGVDATLSSYWKNRAVIWKRFFTFDRRGVVLCGEVNAKNAFGAYVGYKPFSIAEDMGGPMFADDERELKSHAKMCEGHYLLYSEP